MSRTYQRIYLQPGPGVGGHCISVDPWFLVGDYPLLAKVIDESMKTNDYQPVFVLERIHEIMEAHLPIIVAWVCMASPIKKMWTMCARAPRSR